MSAADEFNNRVDDLDLDDEEVDNNNNESEPIELTNSMIQRPESPPPVNQEDRDEEMEDFARQFKSIYESKFADYLRSLKPSEPLNATSMPETQYNKDTYEQDSANSTTILFYFEKLETDEKGNINAVVTKSFDKTEICHFQPLLCKDYGPYFKTNLYCCLYNTGRSGSDTAKNYFLDLPINLYNLIE